MTDFSEEESQLRIEICKQCDSFVVDPPITRCAECGCSISLLISQADQVCPKGKW